MRILETFYEAKK